MVWNVFFKSRKTPIIWSPISKALVSLWTNVLVESNVLYEIFFLMCFILPFVNSVQVLPYMYFFICNKSSNPKSKLKFI